MSFWRLRHNSSSRFFLYRRTQIENKNKTTDATKNDYKAVINIPFSFACPLKVGLCRINTIMNLTADNFLDGCISQSSIKDTAPA